MKHPKDDEIDPLDLQLGADMRHIRKGAGFTQDALGKALGLSFQQIQKYEKGTNRISVSRLVRMCIVLGSDPAPILAKLMRRAR